MTLVYINDEFVPLKEATLPLSDLSIQRGIGVFESVRTYNRQFFALSRHIERLALSAESAGIAFPFPFDRIRDLMQEGLRRFDESQGEILAKPYLTGGDVNEAGRFPNPRFFILFEPLHDMDPSAYTEGVALEPVDLDRPYPAIKSINYLFGYIPRAGNGEVFEALYCPRGEITESTSSNAFMCRGGKILTAPRERVLSGITREIVLLLAKRAGFKVEERCPKVEELASADEFFLTGSVKEILPVVRVGKTRIGKGAPGPVVMHLRKLFAEAIPQFLE